MDATDAQRAAEGAVRGYLARDGTAHRLGITAGHIAPGRVTAHLTVGPGEVNGHGTVHGATLYALADVAFAMACNSHGAPAVARSCSIEYLAPAHAGDALTATAVERAVSGRSGIYDVAVSRDGDGRLLAEFRGHSRTLGPAAPGS